MIRHFITIALIALAACSETKLAEEKAGVKETDTTIFLTVNFVKQSFRIKKSNRMDFVKLQAFLDQYPTVPRLYSDTVSIDFTGDSIPEKVITRIVCQSRDCIIYSDILKEEIVLSSDTLGTNDGLAYMDWHDDSLYFKLKPYSSFYDALRETNRIQELENGKINEDLIGIYTLTIYERLTHAYKDTAKARLAVDSVKRELRNYKGRYILTLDHWDRSLLFWNRFTNKLELLYSP